VANVTQYEIWGKQLQKMFAQVGVSNPRVLKHRTTQRINKGNINSMGSNASFGTQKAELI